MPIRCVCPQGHKILAPEKRAGTTILCPRCRSKLTVPTAEPDKPLAETVDADIPVSEHVEAKPVERKKQADKPERSAAKSKTGKSSRWKGKPSEEAGGDRSNSTQSSKPKATRSARVTEARPVGKRPPAEEKSKQQPATGSDKQTPGAVSPKVTPPPLPSARKKQDEAAPKSEKAAVDSQPANQKHTSGTPSAKKASIDHQSPAKSSKEKSEVATKTTSPKSSPAKQPDPPKPASAKPDLKESPARQSPAPNPSHAEIESSRTEPVATTPAEEPVAEAAPEPAVPVIGVRHRPERIRGVLWLAGVLALLGLFGFSPAVMEWYDYIASEGDQPLARWAWLAIGISLLQLAYAGYLAQLPDWSSVWASAVAALGVAMTYAMLYAVTLLGDADSSLLAWLQIHSTQTGRASGWCFVMLCLNGIFAYFCGRTGAGWRHTEQLRASIGLK